MLQGSSAPYLSSLGLNDSSVQKEEYVFFPFQSERDLFSTDSSITEQTFIYI